MSENIPVLTAGQFRVWLVEGGVHPSRPPLYKAVHKLDDPSQSYGDETRIEVPSGDRFNQFTSVGSIQGEVERASFGLSGRYTEDLSDLLRLAKKRCRVDAFALIGKCKNPQDFTNGWEKILFLRDGKISTWAGENFGALESGDQNISGESVEMSSDDMYEFGLIGLSEVADTEASAEIHTIDICDDESCGDCDDESDGCQRVLATMAGVGATPGTLPQLLYSDDEGVTWNTQDIDTLFSNEVAADGECVGGNFVIVSNDSGSLHFINVDDLYLGNGVWSEVNLGFNAAGAPNAIWSYNVRNTWIVGDGGYIYFTQDPTSSVTVQDAGIATTQKLVAVHSYSEDYVMATGALNAVVYTTNGGETWNSITGPAVGLTLRTCWMWSKSVWFIGDNTGQLWYTTDSGNSWTEKILPAGIDNIDKIEFVNDAEGYMIARKGSGAARILRTMTGGYEWKILPDGSLTSTPAADYFNDMAVCGPGQNLVFAAGLDDDASTGIIVKGEAA